MGSTIHIATDKMAHDQSKLQKKLSIQVDFLRQAKNQQEDTKKEIDQLGATIARIQTEIRFLEDQRLDLLTIRPLNHGDLGPTQVNGEKPTPSLTPLKGAPNSRLHPTGNHGTRNRESTPPTPTLGAWSGPFPLGYPVEDPKDNKPGSPPGTNLAAKQAKMVETCVWTGKDPTHITIPPSYASSVSSEGDYEVFEAGASGRKAAFCPKQQQKPGPYHRQ
jgi:hypothetical protein